ncbi:MAG: glycosyltransferase family 4 protein [Alphaproteobacteria bacterium]|nr:glycosyltransferase family 4 protein [Alphaproteobacteria bacterium]
MKLAFFVSTPVRFTVATPEHTPLGGTESCAAWLSRALAVRGHDVTLLAALPPRTLERVHGVRHVPMEDGTFGFFRDEDFDAVIALSMPGDAQTLKQAAPGAFHVAWLHLAPWEPAVTPLAKATPFIDCAVFVSDWQRSVSHFAGPSQVIGNAIAPPFDNMFSSAEELAAAKENRAVYASAPERGLEILASAFAAAHIETRLDIWSGRSLYQQVETPLPYALPARAHLYAPVSQKTLATAMRSAAFLAYPSIVPETWCIVALEAMAAGMKVISTTVGALPETTMGFADLMPVSAKDRPEEIARRFTPLLEGNVVDFLARKAGWSEERFEQSREIRRRCNWAARAKEWEDFLGPAVAWKRGA